MTTTALPQRVSLVTQTMACLRAHLQAGQWQGHLPAERELAEFLQVSRPTLRAALLELQKEGDILLSGRRREIRLSERVQRETPRVAAILTAKTMEEMPHASVLIVDALRDSMAKAGYAVELRVDRGCFSLKPDVALERMTVEKPAAVWIALGSKETMQRWFLQHQLPLLVIGSCRADVELTSVDKDYRAVCRHAGDLLWRKGHRRVAMVMPKDAYDGDRDSEQGLREAMATHAGAELRIMRHNGSSEHLCSLLDQNLRQSTAYLVLHPIDTLTVASHLIRRGLRIPENVSVLCRDDEVYLQHMSPIITRYAINPVAFAHQVSKSARELAETGRLSSRAIRLLPKLVEGGSVGTSV